MDFGEFDVLFRLGSTRILPGRSRKSLLKPRQERPVAQIRSTSACAPLSRKTQARWTSSRHSALMSSRHIGPLVPFSTTQNMSIRHLQTTNSNMVIGLKRRISLKFFMICSPSCLAFAKKSLITSWRRRLRGHSQSGCPSMLRVPSLPRLMPGYGARRLICSMWGEMQFQRQRQHGWNPRFKEHRLYAIMRLSMSSLLGAPATSNWPALARAWEDGRQLPWTRRMRLRKLPPKLQHFLADGRQHHWEHFQAHLRHLRNRHVGQRRGARVFHRGFHPSHWLHRRARKYWLRRCQRALQEQAGRDHRCQGRGKARAVHHHLRRPRQRQDLTLAMRHQAEEHSHAWSICIGVCL
mmetsp:Transcript_106497/g.193740  ORF Transcript_106497/g.193740 Transcript_106497/m.193740 type:complete len:351 (-) Transcript_106497:1745-2797(-)